jgi:hypothetical protein
MAKTRRVHFSKKKRKSKQRTLKTIRGGAPSWMNAYMPSSKSATPAPATSSVATTPATSSATTAAATTAATKPKGFSYKAYAQNTLKANRSAFNMPVLLAALNSKLNALLVHNNVNYKFSNGYTARDYNISNVVAETANEGRGELIPNATRGQITGVQSAIYNTGKDAFAPKPTQPTPTPIQTLTPTPGPTPPIKPPKPSLISTN